VTLVGRQFQICVAANMKARLLTLESSTGGSARRLEPVERWVRLRSWLSTRMSGPRYCGDVREALYTSAQPACTICFVGLAAKKARSRRLCAYVAPFPRYCHLFPKI